MILSPFFFLFYRTKSHAREILPTILKFTRDFFHSHIGRRPHRVRLFHGSSFSQVQAPM